ncbi:MAG: hypothetical protein KC994_19990 [Candidatus Omnitrophica bacterium]|nr:hypothetical protein [Candidatus Omnitrophota bacterium]
MKEISIPLPDEIADRISTIASAEDLENPAEYVRGLILSDLRQRDEAHLDELIVEGLESGPAQSLTEKDWIDLRTRVAERIRGRSEAI